MDMICGGLLLVLVLASSCVLCCLVRGAENKEDIFPTSGCSPLESKAVGLLLVLLVGSAVVLNSFVFSPFMEASGSTGIETFLSAIGRFGSSGRLKGLFVGDIFGLVVSTRTSLLWFP